MQVACRDAGYYVGVYNNQKYMHEVASYTLRARWVDSSSFLLCPWDCHGHGRCAQILNNPTCVCYDGMVLTDKQLLDSSSYPSRLHVTGPFIREAGASNNLPEGWGRGDKGIGHIANLDGQICTRWQNGCQMVEQSLQDCTTTLSQQSQTMSCGLISVS